MDLIPLAGLLIAFTVGYLCYKKPTFLIRLVTSWLPPSNLAGEMNKSQEIAKEVREHPDTWAQQYPSLYRQIQMIGFGAYFIFVMGVLLFLMSWLLPPAN